MTPSFSEQEYQRLMMLAYLGEWMVNAIRKEPDPTYEDTLSKLYSFTPGTTLEAFATFDDDAGQWVPSEKFESDAHALIDDYDDTTFWEELTARLTERDLIEERGERVVHGMRPDQRIRAAAAIAKTYTKEFEDQGLDRLRVAE